MLDYIASGFLFFSSDLFIIPLIIIGLIGCDRFTFFHAACLVLLSMLLNVALKNTFQVPLSPMLGKVGYAFPSGHMQLVTVLYTWLAWRLGKIGLTFIIIILLIGIGLSLIHFGYHNFYDVLAAVFFALLLLRIYFLATLKWPKQLPWYSLGVASLLLLYIAIRSRLIADYVWMAYYTLWGLVLAESFAANKKFSLRGPNRLLALILCFLLISSLTLIFHQVQQRGFPAYLYQLQWLVIGFIIPWSNFFATKLLRSLNFSY